jgi:uncharacterized protein DUF3515
MADPVRRSAALTATLIAVPVALVVAVGSLLLYGGFSGTPSPSPTPAATTPVTMDAPALAEDAVPVCRTVIAHLPDTVAGQARRPVTAGAEQNAAYGDPPVTLACGTTQPTVDPTADVLTLSGVCWLAAPVSGGTAWTTVDRTIPVTVTVPGPSEGSAQSVVPFSPAVAGGDPRRDTAPSPPGLEPSHGGGCGDEGAGRTG